MSGPYREPATVPLCKHGFRVVQVHHAFEVSLIVRCIHCHEAPPSGGLREVTTLLRWRLGLDR